MPIAAQAASSVDVFNGAREELERMIGKLREGGARAHTEVIGELRKGGAEVQRRLLQGWLDRLLAAERDERPMPLRRARASSALSRSPVTAESRASAAT